MQGTNLAFEFHLRFQKLQEDLLKNLKMNKILKGQ